MSTVAKVLVVLNLVLAFAFLGSAASYLGHQDHWKTKHDTATAKLQEDLNVKNEQITNLESETSRLGNDLTSANQAKDAAVQRADRSDAELETLKTNYGLLASDNTKLTSAYARFGATIDALKSQNEKLQEQLIALNQDIVRLRQERDAASDNSHALQLQLDNETATRKGYEQQIANTEESLKRANFELRYYKDMYPGGIGGPAQPAHQGQILAADNDANVYVISLGAEDGVKVGFQYVVSRGSEYIGTIQINDVQNKKAAGFALKGMRKSDIQRGDAAMSR